MLLCDYAEDVNGKLYVMGGGWNRLLANQPTSIAVAIVVEVPWDQTNRPLAIKLALVTEDGEPVMPDGEHPVQVEGKFEVGRPPGTKHGSLFNAPLAIKLQFVLPEGGYRFEFSLDGEIVSLKPFTVVSAL